MSGAASRRHSAPSTMKTLLVLSAALACVLAAQVGEVKARQGARTLPSLSTTRWTDDGDGRLEPGVTM